MSHAATCLAGHPHDEPDLGAVTVAERTPSMAPPTAAARFSMPQVRWALLSTVLFASGLLLRLAGAPGWLSGMVFAGCYLAGGWEPAVAGWQALRERTLDVDLLIVIFATSGAQEAYATKRTADSVNALLTLAPEQATLLGRDGMEAVVDTAALQVGDEILIRPGERIGADGTVTDGTSEVDQASVTGEPLPLLRGPGDEVFAGTLNTHGALRVKPPGDPDGRPVRCRTRCPFRGAAEPAEVHPTMTAGDGPQVKAGYPAVGSAANSQESASAPRPLLPLSEPRGSGHPCRFGRPHLAGRPSGWVALTRRRHPRYSYYIQEVIGDDQMA